MSRFVLILIPACCWCVRSGIFGADEPAFRRHVINSESTYSPAPCSMSMRDGLLDIVSGGCWYAAPTWEKRFLRDVEEIRGRFDDYSNLQFDVNGDGHFDTISCNYRSESIYWVQHPGANVDAGVAWERHVAATPGTMETGRLVDIDGDGRLDVLPNGTKFAAWWNIEPGSNSEVESLRTAAGTCRARHWIWRYQRRWSK